MLRGTCYCKRSMALAGWRWPDYYLDWLRNVCRRRTGSGGSLLANTNRYRLLWMMQTTSRENRVVDAVVVQNLSTSPSFFASTTILIIGGLLAVLGTQGAADLGQRVSVYHRYESVRV